MMDEAEYKEMMTIYSSCVASLKSYRSNQMATLEEAETNTDAFRPLQEWVHLRLGKIDYAIEELRHHRLSDFGPPCKQCGHPLRTPRARRCANCGLALS